MWIKNKFYLQQTKVTNPLGLTLKVLFLQTVKENLETMYAVLEIAGKQYKVESDKYLYVDKLEGAEGDKVDFDKVLLLDNEGDVKVGAPTVEGVKVSGKILEQVKADKVIVFKKKRRKGYKKRNGHRQQMTKVLIESITA